MAIPAVSSRPPCRGCGAPMPGAAKWCPTCRTPIDEGPASTRRTELPPEQAAATLTRALSGMGAHVTSQTSTAITGFVKVRRTPNVFVAILLFLLCIVPLVIYLIAQSKDDTFPFAFELVARNDGTEVRWSGTGPAADIARGAAGTLPA